LTEEKPTIAFIVSLLGGLFIVLAGLLILAAAVVLSKITSMSFPMPMPFMIQGLQDFMELVGGIETLFGLVVIVGAILLNAHPENHVTWGVFIILFSLISIVGSGGFVIGLVLGFIGGVLAIIWNPPSPAAGGPLVYPQPPYQSQGYGQPGYPLAGYQTPYQQQHPTNPPAPTAQARYCSRCGASVNPGAAFCSACGNRL